MTPNSVNQDSAVRPPPKVGPLVVALAITGLLARVAPFFEGGQRYLQRFPTEDGYLMLTIARNLALGKGFATADGTMPTNGTQPMATLLWSGLYTLVDGHRTLGVALVLCVELLVAALAAYGLYRLGRKVFSNHPQGQAVAGLAAAAWYASPNVVPHSMNCLETGLYGLTAIWAANLFLEPTQEVSRGLSWGRAAALGVVLGICFWARIDAVFLIAAICLAHLHRGLPHGMAIVRKRFYRVLLFGAVSVLVASPWLLYNYLSFGHIMPISGRLEADIGELPLPVLPVVLVEYAGVLLPIPHKLEEQPWAIAAATAIALAVLYLAYRAFRAADEKERALMVIVGIYGVGLCTYYGLFFGASWFLSRYIFPLSAFLALFWARLALGVWTRIPWLEPRGLRSVVAAAVVLVVASVSVRNYLAHRHHEHFQVVRWVQENVPDDVWVGAIQTGTLGYYHDKTINLDGKVNPDALKAKLAGKRAEYFVDSGIQYIPDWQALGVRAAHPLMASHFELIVDDRERNLSVLRRRKP